MVKRILIALSGSPYEPSVIKHAIEMAKRHEAEITGVTVADLELITNVGSVPIGGGAAASELAAYREAITQEHIDAAIEQFEQACRDIDIQHRVVRTEGDPFDEVASLWRYHDLMIFGLRGMFEYGIVKNPDDVIIRMVREGVRPVLAVSQQYREIKRILIAYNGSREAAMAMKRVVQQRFWPDPIIRIACFEFPESRAKVMLRDAKEYCRAHGIEADTAHLPDRSRKDLLTYADEWNADLVTIGSVARSKFARWVLGDTALHLIRNSDIPLYISR